jgi:hypothetical protein
VSTSQSVDVDEPQVRNARYIGVANVTAQTIQRKLTGQIPKLNCQDTIVKLPFGGTINGAPRCTTIMTDIYQDVPVMSTQKQTVSFDLPYVDYVESAITIETPVLSIQTLDVTVPLPQFRDPETLAAAKALKDTADTLASEVATANASAVKDISDGLQDLYNCYLSEITHQSASEDDRFYLIVSQVDKAIQSIRAGGADPANVLADNGGQNPITQRGDLLAKQAGFRQRISKITDQMRNDEMNIISRIQQ